jgi:hypothetical protein
MENKKYTLQTVMIGFKKDDFSLRDLTILSMERFVRTEFMGGKILRGDRVFLASPITKWVIYQAMMEHDDFKKTDRVHNRQRGNL